MDSREAHTPLPEALSVVPESDDRPITQADLDRGVYARCMGVELSKGAYDRLMKISWSKADADKWRAEHDGVWIEGKDSGWNSTGALHVRGPVTLHDGESELVVALGDVRKWMQMLAWWEKFGGVLEEMARGTERAHRPRTCSDPSDRSTERVDDAPRGRAQVWAP